MRVLVAYDGSAGAEQAVALAGALRWPADTTLTVAAVVERPIQQLGLPSGVTATPEIDTLIREHHHETVSEAARRLGWDSLEAEGVVLDGRPATALLEEAGRVRADLIIAGSRGRGRVASLVLGSVSAELVDNAACPVLVARTGRVSRVVLAVDDSVPAAAAESLVADWAIFDGLPIHVLSVTDMMEPVQFGRLARPEYRQAAAEHAAYFAEAQENHLRIATEAAERLRDGGRDADPAMRTGGAADEILDYTAETGVDLIVMGSQGRTGMARIVLGSVARNVLHGSRISVLIVRSRNEP